MFYNKIKNLEEKITELSNQILKEKENHNQTKSLLTQEKENLEKRIAELEKLLQKKEALIEEIEKEKKALLEKESSLSYLKDKGYQTLLGFQLIPPFLDKVLGRPFMITVSQEFNYVTTPDREALEKRKEAVAKSEGPGFETFRDVFRPQHSLRVVYCYSSKEYYLSSPKGKITLKQFMFPEDLKAGVEISSQFRSAMYLCIKHNSLQSAVLPEQVFGAPLLSYAFPIHNEKGVTIGGVSFSNDISNIVKIATSLGNIVATDSDQILKNLGNILKEELKFTQEASKKVKEESIFSQKVAELIRKKGQEVIEIAERLKVLALNTAIESTKVGASGKGVGVIADQMKTISENTRKTLKEIFDQSLLLYRSSNEVYQTSNKLENSALKLKEESNILFNTSLKITSQKDDLAALVRMSIDEIAQNQEDINAIFMLIKNQKKT